MVLLWNLIKFCIAGAIGDVCGLLGALGGAENSNKLYRRLGIPLVLTILITLTLCLKFGIIGLFGLCTMLLFPILTIGYGIPSWNGPNNSMDDEGSPLGRFWYKLVKGSITGPDTKAEKKATILTRTTIGILFALVPLVIAILSHAWLFYIIIAKLIILNTVLWGAIIENEGMFMFKGKLLSWEEFLIYYGLGFFNALYVLFC
jgi:hypothetical protein